MPRTASGQQPDSASRRDTLEARAPISVAALVVTATRAPRLNFQLAAPVAVVGADEIERLAPNSAADLFRDLPGLDVNGVGPSQGRPIIRGQRGQRILLLEDGLRMNNTRRQQDFGELPALVDPRSLRRVEVVRGPASVLYGSDAIGGVVNLITDEPPPLLEGDVFGGSLRYVYRGDGDQQRPSGTVFGRRGKLGFTASATFRDAEPYLAPAGTFGGVTLADDAVVNDTGVEDRNLALRLSYDVNPRHRLSAKIATYSAQNTGFGFVNNEALGAIGDPTIQILYPDQNVERFTVGYEGLDLGFALADRFDVKAYYSNNERDFDLDIFIPFSPQTPEAGISVVTDNFTDIETLGLRAEAARVVSDWLVLTYGGDYFNDDSRSTDHNVTQLVGAGPPDPQISDVPTVPNSDYRSGGVFAQGELQLHERASLIVGARYQRVSAEARQTPNVETPPSDFSDGTFVAAANLLVSLTPHLNLAANLGRGFRGPNLIELFFSGPTPEGRGFQLRNPDLESETSLNVDVGLKLDTDRMAAEIFYFRNNVKHGIRAEPTGQTVDAFDEFRNVNVDEIRYRGVDFAVELRPADGLGVGGSFSWLDSEDVLNPGNPIGESYGSKLTGHVRYVDPGGRFWGEWRLRHNGESSDGQVLTGPVGTVLPSFTVQDIRAGARLFRRQGVDTGVVLSVTNLTNELYAEASNASFFRPQPRRSAQLALSLSF